MRAVSPRTEDVLVAASRLSTQQSEPIGATSARFDSLQPGDRYVTVVNHDGMPGTDLSQIGAEVILQIRHCSLLHIAIIAS